MATDQPLDLIDLGVLSLDRDGRIIGWNGWLEEHGAPRREEVMGRVLWEIYPELETRGLKARISQVLDSGQPQVLSPSRHGRLLPLVNTWGEPMLQLARLIPLVRHGRRAGVLITLQDMTPILRVEAELLRVAEQLRLLQETAGSLVAMKGFRATLQAIADRILEAMHARLAVVFMHDARAECLRATVWRARGDVSRVDETLRGFLGRAVHELVIPCSHSWNPMVEIFTTGRALFGVPISSLGFQARPKQAFSALGAVLKRETVTLLPLKVGERAVGMLALDSPPGDAITPRDRALYRAFAAQASVAIENAQLFDQLQEERRRLERRAYRSRSDFQRLFEFSQRLGQAMDYEELAQLILTTLDQVFQTDFASALFIMEDTLEVWLSHRRPLDPELEARLQNQMEEVLQGLGAENFADQKFRMHVVASGQDASEGLPLEGRLRSTSAPLMKQNQIVGLIQVWAPGEQVFGKQEVRVLHALASAAVLALQRLEVVLERERSLLQTMVDGMADAVILFNEAGQMVAANSLGQKFRERICGCLQNGRTPGACPLHALAADVLRKRAGSVDREIEADARFYVARATSPSLPYAGRHSRGVVITVRDVTEERGLQEQLFQSSKLAAIGELAAGLAHEINNPLTAVLGYAELLLMDVKDENVRESLDNIRRQGLRARDIVQNLLRFARARELDQGGVDLNVAVRQTVDLLRRQLELDNIQVVETYDPDLPPPSADASQLQQVVLNLLQNAHDAISLSGKGSRVMVRTRRSGKDKLAFEVEDDGPGIPKDTRERIFNPFFTTKPPGKGTGLGLTISHKIVENHGGRISVRSRRGGGARFVVELPLRHLPDPPASEEGLKPGDQPSGLRILLVDDDPDVLKVTGRMLEEAGHHLDKADRAQEALERLAGADYDVIILDIKMPDLSGQDLYRLLEEQHPELTPRVLFVTGLAMARETESFLQKTGRPLLNKPFSSEDLLTAVARVTAQSHEA